MNQDEKVDYREIADVYFKELDEISDKVWATIISIIANRESYGDTYVDVISDTILKSAEIVDKIKSVKHFIGGEVDKMNRKIVGSVGFGDSVVKMYESCKEVSGIYDRMHDDLFGTVLEPVIIKKKER